MGFRFRKSIGLGKGVRVNLGKRGASLSMGGRGVTYNIGRKGGHATFGIPGTGVSYRAPRHSMPVGWIVIAIIAFVVAALIFS
jgi:hypothetical protein